MNLCTPDDEFEGETVKYRCRCCGNPEEISLGVVEYFHIVDSGDSTVPPRFSCEHCGGEMWPTEDWEARVHGESFEQIDPRLPTMPFPFACEHCGGEMRLQENWEGELEQFEWQEEYEEDEEDELPIKVNQIFNTDKIGRNDLCLCGSGKKYKRCCGKN